MKENILHVSIPAHKLTEKLKVKITTYDMHIFINANAKMNTTLKPCIKLKGNDLTLKAVNY